MSTMLHVNKKSLCEILAGRRLPTADLLYKFKHSKRGAYYDDYQPSWLNACGDLAAFDARCLGSKVKIIRNVARPANRFD